MVLSLPNGKGEAGGQDPAVGKHPSPVDVLLTNEAAAALLVIFSIRHSCLPLACGICDRAVKPQGNCSYSQMQNPCRVLLSSLSLLTHDSCLGSPSQAPADLYLTAPRVCQEKGLCLILLVFTFNQENILCLCFIQPIPTWGKERKL